MNQEERLKIVKNIKNVNYACLSIDKDFTVNKTIEQLVKDGNFKISSFGFSGYRGVIHFNPLNLLSNAFASMAFFKFTLLKSTKSLVSTYLYQ